MDRDKPAMAGTEPLTLETALKMPSADKKRGRPRSMSARDADARERLWQAVQIVAKVEAHLRAVADGRRLAELHLAEIARFGKRERLLGVF